MDKVKRCCSCNKELQIHLFGKRASNEDGINSVCKECRRDKYYENKTYILRKRKLHYEINKTDIFEYKKIYRSKNKLRITAYNHCYYEINKDKIIKTQKLNQSNLIIAISDSYATKRIKSQSQSMSLNDIPQELIEIKRTILKTKRLCRTLKNSEVN